MNRTEYGYPQLERAKSIAAEARIRNFPPPCQCATCVSVANLPSVMRILSKWTPLMKDEK